MKKQTRVIFFVSIFLAMLASGCAPASTPVPPTLTAFPTASPMPPTDTPLPTATNTPEATPTEVPSPETALKDLRVRQAIAYCTDRSALAQAVVPNAQVDTLMMDSFLPKDNWAYVSPSAIYPFSPSTGQELLDQAGWTLPANGVFRTNGQGVELVITLKIGDRASRKKWTDLLISQMQDCGIQVERIIIDITWWFGETTGFKARDYQLAVSTMVIGPEDNPDVFSLFGCESIPSSDNNFQGDNYSGWCNQIASQAVKQASDLTLSQEARRPYFITFQEEYAKDIPSIPLFSWNADSTYEYLYINLAP